MAWIGIIIITALVSYQGFKDYTFFETYKFNVGKILYDKDYKRLVSSGFLHADWTHFIFNMLSFYFFSQGLERNLGIVKFVALYIICLIAGNLFSLVVNKNYSNYSAIGASGAVSGIIFAAIALFPGMEVHMMFIPIGIPSWLYGILFLAYSIYGMKTRGDNIGHEAHLGGALAGMVVAVILIPEAMDYNKLTILAVGIPMAIFTYLIIKKPDLLNRF